LDARLRRALRGHGYPDGRDQGLGVVFGGLGREPGCRLASTAECPGMAFGPGPGRCKDGAVKANAGAAAAGGGCAPDARLDDRGPAVAPCAHRPGARALRLDDHSQTCAARRGSADRVLCRAGGGEPAHRGDPRRRHDRGPLRRGPGAAGGGQRVPGGPVTGGGGSLFRIASALPGRRCCSCSPC